MNHPFSPRFRRVLIGPVLGALLALSGRASAEGPRLHAAGGAAHAAGNAQSRELGWGGRASLGAELPVARTVSVEVEGAFAGLAKGEELDDPTLAPREAGSVVTGVAGAVLRPLGDGPYIAAGGGGAATGGLVRPALTARLGWEIPIGGGSWGIGPTAGYTHVFQPDSALRPDDARILWGGLEASFGAPRKAPPRASAPESITANPAPRPQPSRTDEPNHSAEAEATIETVRMDGDRIAVDERIEFAFDSDELEESALPVIVEIADYVRRTPQITAIRIEGHADELGPDRYNERLSERRAEAVRRALAAQLPGVVLSARGYGKSRPLAQGRSDEDRRKNRRVTFVVTSATGGPLAGRDVPSDVEAGQ